MAIGQIESGGDAAVSDCNRLSSTGSFASVAPIADEASSRIIVQVDRPVPAQAGQSPMSHGVW